MQKTVTGLGSQMRVMVASVRRPADMAALAGQVRPSAVPFSWMPYPTPPYPGCLESVIVSIASLGLPHRHWPWLHV